MKNWHAYQIFLAFALYRMYLDKKNNGHLFSGQRPPEKKKLFNENNDL